MLHIPSMLTYGFLSFVLAFFNKALFDIAQFHCNLFMIFIQLIFILLSFHILSYLRILTLPTLNKTDLYTLLIPSTFYCLSTVLSLQTLMTLNVTIYVVIKVNTNLFFSSFEILIGFCFSLALYTSVNFSSLSCGIT